MNKDWWRSIYMYQNSYVSKELAGNWSLTTLFLKWDQEALNPDAWVPPARQEIGKQQLIRVQRWKHDQQFATKPYLPFKGTFINTELLLGILLAER